MSTNLPFIPIYFPASSRERRETSAVLGFSSISSGRGLSGFLLLGLLGLFWRRTNSTVREAKKRTVLLEPWCICRGRQDGGKLFSQAEWHQSISGTPVPRGTAAVLPKRRRDSTVFRHSPLTLPFYSSYPCCGLLNSGMHLSTTTKKDGTPELTMICAGRYCPVALLFSSLFLFPARRQSGGKMQGDKGRKPISGGW